MKTTKRDGQILTILATILIVFLVFVYHVIQPIPEKLGLSKIGTTKEVHIYTKDQIGPPKKVMNLIVYLRKAKKDTTIYLHLAGQGGRLDSTIRIINAIRETKATVVTVIDGDVYSGHAFIAMSGHRIIIKPGVLFMFHRSSYYNMAEILCAPHQKGIDRGLSQHSKCILSVKESLKASGHFLSKLMAPYLTEEEMYKMMHGHDVYVQGYEMKKRIAK